MPQGLVFRSPQVDPPRSRLRTHGVSHHLAHVRLREPASVVVQARHQASRNTPWV